MTVECHNYMLLPLISPPDLISARISVCVTSTGNLVSTSTLRADCPQSRPRKTNLICMQTTEILAPDETDHGKGRWSDNDKIHSPWYFRFSNPPQAWKNGKQPYQHHSFQGFDNHHVPSQGQHTWFINRRFATPNASCWTSPLTSWDSLLWKP